MERFKNVTLALLGCFMVLPAMPGTKWDNEIHPAIARAMGTPLQRLFRYARTGDVGGVRHFLDVGLDVNARNEIGCTLLREAASYGSVDVVRLLIERGATLDMPFPPALCNAAIGGHREVASLLVEHGSDLEGRYGRYRLKPLHYVFSCGPPVMRHEGMLLGGPDLVRQSVRMLLELGASMTPDEHDSAGWLKG